MSTHFDVCKSQLDNGLVVISEKMPHVRSVSFGIFLRAGSRHETPEVNGMMHFIEHSLFKGTRRRSAAEIAAESDELGGHLDAFTSREMVGFHTKVLDEHLPRAFDLVADLVTAPAFDPEELEKERNVILEEIKMVEDTPDDLVFEIFSENYYPDHPLGRPILGTPETLATFEPQRVQDYYHHIYRPDYLVVVAAGNLEHELLLELAHRYFGQQPRSNSALVAEAPRPVPHITLRHKAELEQAHLIIGTPGTSLTSEDRYTAHILNSILGGGMSSRLFQSIREERGLVYTVFSSVSSFKDSGYMTIYAGTSTEQLSETIDAAMIELQRLKEEAVGDKELQRNKDQLKTSLMLNLESTSARMSAIIQQELIFGHFFTPDEIIACVDAVTANDVQRLANELFQPESLAVTVLGNLDGFKIERKQLKC